MYILNLCVHLHLIGAKVHTWEVWGKIVGLSLQFIKFVADLKTIKRRGTKAANLEYSLGLDFTFKSWGDKLRTFLQCTKFWVRTENKQRSRTCCAKQLKITIVAFDEFTLIRDGKLDSDDEHSHDGGIEHGEEKTWAVLHSGVELWFATRIELGGGDTTVEHELDHDDDRGC